MENSKLRKLQLCELEILKHFIDVCKKNKLTYYISGGTYLGAVRHKGFIPWDDDIDIALPRTDYEKAIKILKDDKNSKYVLSTFEDESETVHYQAKLFDTSIKLINNSGKNSQLWSAWIDIFPLDGMPNNFFINEIHKLHLMYLRARLKFTCFDNQVNLKEKNRPLIEKILIWIGLHTKFGRNKESIYYLRKIDKCLKKYSEKKSKVYINFMGAYKLKSIINKEEIYAEGAKYEFEGLELNGPKEYDKYLTHIYGDYMTIPKKEEQNKHNTEVINLMDNFKKYKIGYTQGTYDLFHIGHLNLLENAKKECEYLIVGINSDQLVKQYKNKNVVIDENSRSRIVKALKIVDEVYIIDTLDKEKLYERFKFDAIFIGDDWKGNERWKNTEINLKKYGVDVRYLPHTDGISTTLLVKKILDKKD